MDHTTRVFLLGRLVIKFWAAEDKAQAFEAIYAICYPLVWRFIKRMGGPAASEADELAQETMLAVYRGLNNLDDPLKVEAYLLATAKNKFYDWHRPHKIVSVDLPDCDFESSDASPEKELYCREVLRQAMACLSERQQSCCILLAKGYKIKEIAQKLGICEGAVKKHLHNARLKLRGCPCWHEWAKRGKMAA